MAIIKTNKIRLNCTYTLKKDSPIYRTVNYVRGTKMKDMSKIGEEIIKLKIDMNKSFAENLEDFYAIMRKYEIYQGTLTGNGSVAMANFDWTMCLNLYISQFDYAIKFHMMMDNVPTDLQYKGKCK